VTRRKVGNPLALAVLACLFERPMHPYEMAATLRERHKDESIKLNYGSLYSVVEALQRHGLIEAQETERNGRRPERTVYAITNPGALELTDWLSELLSTPVKEYRQFEAALSLLPVLEPAEVVELLEERCRRLETQLSQRRAVTEMLESRRLPRLFSVEFEYSTVLLEAELEWVRTLVTEIEAGTLEGSEFWSAIHTEQASAPNHRTENGVLT
jgi:DNA-binding PadR family transcriptional regulator